MNYLTPMSIAFLLKDAGSWVSGFKRVIISTNKIIFHKIELLRDTFKAKFNLDCTIHLLTKN
jgi:hypothetical protein